MNELGGILPYAIGADGFGFETGAPGFGAPSVGAEPDPRLHPYHPQPDAGTGELLIDPDIRLTAKKFNLAIDFFYSSQNDADLEYGRGRSASIKGYIASTVSAGQTRVTIVRGNFVAFNYDLVGTSGGITTYAAVANSGANSTLSFDGTKFTEYLHDGMQLTYQSQVAGGNPVTHQLVSAKDAGGNTQTYTYGSGSEAGLLKSVQVPGGNLATFIYTPSGGSVSLLNAVQDWSSRRWTFQYDSNRYMTTLTTPLGCATVYGYSLAGSPVTMVQTITDPRGFVTTYQYDSSRRVISMAAADANWTWTFMAGRSFGKRSVMTSPSGAVTTSNYDTTIGNLNTLNRPEGYTTTYTYVNRMKTQEQVPAGVIYSVTYDQTLWLITASDDPLGNRTTYAYDSFGNLTTLTDGNGKTSTFAYDGTGSTRQRIRATDPLGRVTAYTYTSDGQLKAVTDPRSLITICALLDSTASAANSQFPGFPCQLRFSTNAKTGAVHTSAIAAIDCLR